MKRLNLKTAGLAVAALAMLSMASCATAVRGKNQDFTVTSEPSGADVRLSNGMTGQTPATFKVARKHPITAEVSKEGYETTSATATPKVQGGGVAAGAGNVLAGGVIGVGIDAATGAMKDLTPNPLHVVLPRAGTSVTKTDGPPATRPEPAKPEVNQ